MFTARQGDVFIRASKIPKEAKKQKVERVILAYGEVTGHAHEIDEVDNVELYELNGRMFLRVSEDANLKHQEHATVEIPIGTYEVIHQREYTPEEIRRVQD